MIEPGRLSLRRAETSDHAQLLALHRQHGWDTAELVDGEWAITRDGEIVGAASVVTICPELLYLGALVIEESHRGLGIGTWAMGQLTPPHDVTWWTECRDSRIAFYTRCGFHLRDAADIPDVLRVYLDQPGVLPWRQGRPHNFMSLMPQAAGEPSPAG